MFEKYYRSDSVKHWLKCVTFSIASLSGKVIAPGTMVGCGTPPSHSPSAERPGRPGGPGGPEGIIFTLILDFGKKVRTYLLDGTLY